MTGYATHTYLNVWVIKIYIFVYIRETWKVNIITSEYVWRCGELKLNQCWEQRRENSNCRDFRAFNVKLYCFVLGTNIVISQTVLRLILVKLQLFEKRWTPKSNISPCALVWFCFVKAIHMSPNWLDNMNVWKVAAAMHCGTALSFPLKKKKISWCFLC